MSVDRGNSAAQIDDAWCDEVRSAAGLRSLSPAWAKAEIVLGLATSIAGLKLLMLDSVTVLAGVGLAVLGGYLAMAGNRSHLYQSQNRQTALLLRGLRRRNSGAE